MKHRKKAIKIASLIALTFLLSACWDQKDIETRGYVLGVAIDSYPPNPIQSEDSSSMEARQEEEKALEYMELHTEQPVYAMTAQLPILRKTSQSAGGEESSGSEGSFTWVITQIGNSFMGMNREMQSRTSLSLYYEHLQVIVISDKVARRGMDRIIDFFTRDPEMLRRVRVFISKGEAKSVLDVNPRSEEYSSIYLAMLPMNANKNSRMVYRTDLGEIIQDIHAEFDFVLPMAQATTDEIKISGGAAFKEGKMVGWVSGLELEATKHIRNLYMGGIITTNSPVHEEAIIVLEVTNAKTKVTPIIKGEEVSFDIKINVTGNYAEDINMPAENLVTDRLLNKLQDAFEKEIEQICVATINKFQAEYGADVFRFNQILQTEEPAYWRKIGHKWSAVFPTVDVKVNADVTIDLTGITK